MIASIMPRRSRRPLLAAVAVATAIALPAIAQDGATLYVELQSPARLSYAGDPNLVNILFKNRGNASWNNPGMNIESGFEVFDSNGKKLSKKDAPASSREGQPAVLEPEAYFGKIVNLSEMFPDMNLIGSYRVTWSAPGVQEQTVVKRVIRKYDEGQDYQGIIDTEFGRIVLEFYKDLAPLHVKNFIDLANQGFYDGVLFHRTIKGEAIFGGSPTGDERGAGYNIPPEPNGLKILAGSIAQVRNSLSGANESGSIFMIAATEQPNMDSRFTVFARVVEGLEAVKAITNLPSIGGTTRIASRPIRDVVMKKVSIREKKGSKAS